jgi:hypothetical protein
MFKEIIAAYWENYKKHIGANCKLLAAEAGGIYSYHQDVKG